MTTFIPPSQQQQLDEQLKMQENMQPSSNAPPAQSPPPEHNVDLEALAGQLASLDQAPTPEFTPSLTQQQAAEQMPRYDELNAAEKWLYAALPAVAKIGDLDKSKEGYQSIHQKADWVVAVRNAASEYTSPAFTWALDNIIDPLAVATERTLGLVTQFKVASDPNNDYTMEEFTENLGDAWFAGSLFYDANALPNLGVGNEGDWEYMLVPGIDTTSERVTAIFDAQRKITSLTDQGMDRKTALAFTEQEMYQDLGALAIRAQAYNLIGHIVLDPLEVVLPMLSPIEKLHVSRLDVLQKPISTVDDLTAWDKLTLKLSGGIPGAEPGKLSKYNPFALTPESRAYEFMGNVSDRVGGTIFSQIDDPYDAYRTMELAANNLLGPEFGHAFLTLEGRMAQSVVSESLTKVSDVLGDFQWLDEGGHIRFLEDAAKLLDDTPAGIVGRFSDDITLKATIDTLSKGGMDMAKVDPNIIKEIGEFGGKQVPYTRELFKLYAGEKIRDVAARQSILKFGLDQQGFLQKSASALKSAETLAFLRLNPGFAVKNFVNNEFTMIARGVGGHVSMDDINHLVDDVLGFEPYRFSSSQAAKGASEAGVRIGGSVVEGAVDLGGGERVISKALRGDPKGLSAAADAVADYFNKLELPGPNIKVGPDQVKLLDMGSWAGKAEVSASRRAFYQGYMDGWDMFWKPNSGYTNAHEALRAAGLPNDMLDLLNSKIAGSMNPKQLDEAFFTERKMSNSLIDNVEKDYNMKFGDLGMDRAVLQTKLDDALQKGPSATRKAVNEIRENALSHIDDLTKKNAGVIRDKAKVWTQTSGPKGAALVYGDAYEDLLHARTSHNMRSSNTYKPSREFADQYWAKKFSEDKAFFSRTWDRVEEAVDGIKQGAGKWFPKEIKTGFTDMKKGWNDFFTGRNKRYQDYFKLPDNKRSKKAWEELLTLNDEAYAAATKAEAALMESMDNSMLALLAKQDQQAALKFDAWRTQSRNLWQTDQVKTANFMADIHRTPAAQQFEKYQTFHKERWEELSKMWENERKGIANMANSPNVTPADYASYKPKTIEELDVMVGGERGWDALDETAKIDLANEFAPPPPPPSAVDEYATSSPRDWTRDEYEDALRIAKEAEVNTEVFLFGEEEAIRYATAQQTANSSFAPQDKLDEANRVIDELEAALTPKEKDILFGVDESGMSYEDLKTWKDEFAPPPPPPEYAAVSPLDMTREEYQDALRIAKEAEENTEVFLFGEEGAKKYKQAQITANSPLASPDRLAEADRVMDELEAALTPDETNILFGVDEQGLSYEDLKEWKDAFDDYSQYGDEELFQYLKTSLIDDTDIGNKKVEEIVKQLDARGLSPEEMLNEVGQKLSEDVGVQDAELLIRSALEKKAAAAPSAVDELAAGTPRNFYDMKDEIRAKVNEYVETPRHQIDPDVSKALEEEAYRMLAEVEEGIQGQRIFDEDSGKFSHAYGSTYPSWYSEPGASKQSMVNALKKIIKDEGADVGTYVERLKMIGLDNLTKTDPRVMRAVGDEGNAMYTMFRAMERGEMDQLMNMMGDDAEEVFEWYLKNFEQYVDEAGEFKTGDLDFTRPEIPGFDDVEEIAPAYATLDEVPEDVLEKARRQWMDDNPEVPDIDTSSYYPGNPRDATSSTDAMTQPYWAADQVYHGKTSSMVDDLETKLLDTKQQKGLVWDDLSPDQTKQVKGYLAETKGQMSDTRYASIRFGEYKKDSALLNYNRRFNYNTWLGTVVPYEFWTTQSVMKWAIHSIDKPAMLATYMRMKEFINTAGAPNTGFPSRLRGKIRIPLPFMPDWMGNDGIYFDPLQFALPFDGWTQGYDKYFGDKRKLESRAQRFIEDKISAGEIGSAEGLKAIQDQSGKYWDLALQASTYDNTSDKWDVIETLISPHPFAEWAYYMATDQKDKIGRIPLATDIKQVAGAFGVNPSNEKWGVVGNIRNELGLHAFDGYDDYRVERMLSNMTAMGEITVDSALRAQIEQEGEIWDLASSRAAKEFSGGSPIATAAKLLGMPVQTYPRGEQLQRGLKDDLDAAYAAQEAGNATAVRDFYDEHPEYETRLALWKEPEEKMKSFLADEIWTMWHDLPGINKNQVVEALGPMFESLFLNKETRNPDNIPVEMMQVWSKMMGGDPPGTLNSPVVPIEFANPEEAWRVQQFKTIRMGKFPDFYDLQTEYYKPGTNQKAFRAENPELVAYWDWRRDYFNRNPDVVPYLDDDFEFKYPSSEAYDQAVQAQPQLTKQEWEMALGGPAIVRLIEYDTLPREAMDYLKAEAEKLGLTLDQLITHVLNSQ